MDMMNSNKKRFANICIFYFSSQLLLPPTLGEKETFKRLKISDNTNFLWPNFSNFNVKLPGMWDVNPPVITGTSE